MEIVQARIDRLRKKTKNPRKKHVLSDQECKEYLDFQKRFVLVPADKARNNVVIVCKKILLRCSAKRT